MTSMRTGAHRGRGRMLATLVAAGLLGACSAPAGTAGPGAATPAATASGQATAPAGSPASGGPGSGATLDACSLLTEADILEITGFPVAEMNPAPADTTFPSACEWKLEGTIWLIALGVASPGGQATWDALVPYTQGEAVTGIGDEAFLAEAGGDLMVRRGDTFFDIQYVAVGEPEGTQDRLALRVLDRLP